MTGLRVGYVLKVYPRLSETFIVNEILELERQGVEVTVFSLKVPREGRFHEKLARVRAEVVYLPDRGPAELLRLLAERHPELRSRRDLILDLLWEELETGAPDARTLGKAVDVALAAEARGIGHLHAHFATVATEVARRASVLSGIPFSFTAHAKDIYQEERDLAILPRAMNEAAFGVTVCDANVRALAAYDGSAPLHRIYNGLDLEDFRPASPVRAERLRLLGVGRLVPKKGFDLLVRACRQLADDGLDFECRIAGDGMERDALETLVAAEGMSDRVTLLGAISNEQVRQEFAAADLFVLPCRVAADGNRDALPTVLLESMALGCPVVTTPVTGNPEITGEGVAGVLVPEDDPEALADAIRDLARDPDRLARLREAGLQRVAELFDVRRSVAELASCFAGSSRVAEVVS